MRLAPWFVLLPAFAAAQDVPSLQRPNPALPITASVEVLDSRLGKPGGAFAAAQLAPLGRDDVLRAAAQHDHPLRRLDAAYGLSGLDRPEDRLALAALLGDTDPSVSAEAETALIRIGKDGVGALHARALRGGDAAGNAAFDLLLRFEPWQKAADVATTPGAAGRAMAISTMPLPISTGLPIAEAAVADSRPDVRQHAIGWILASDRARDVRAAISRLVHSPSPAVRAVVAKTVGAEYSVKHAALLVVLAQDPSPMVRRAVVDAAGQWLGHVDRPTALAVTMRLVGDPDPTVSDAAFERMAADAQGQYPPIPIDLSASSTATAALRRGLLRRLDGPQAFKAAVLLADLRDSRAYPVLAPVAFGSGYEAMCHLAAIRGLGRTGDRRATPGLLRLTGSSDANVASAAYAALADLRDPASVAFLLATVHHEPNGWGPSAAQVIAAVGDRAATPSLLAAARSLPPGPDGNLFEPLGKLGGPGVREYLLDRLEYGAEGTLSLAARGLIALHDFASFPELTRLASGTGRRAEEARRVLAVLRR